MLVSPSGATPPGRWRTRLALTRGGRALARRVGAWLIFWWIPTCSSTTCAARRVWSAGRALTALLGGDPGRVVRRSSAGEAVARLLAPFQGVVVGGRGPAGGRAVRAHSPSRRTAPAASCDAHTYRAERSARLGDGSVEEIGPGGEQAGPGGSGVECPRHFVGRFVDRQMTLRSPQGGHWKAAYQGANVDSDVSALVVGCSTNCTV